MSNVRTTEYHARFHDLLSKIEAAGIDLHDMAQRKNFARSVATVAPQFPGAWTKNPNSEVKSSLYSRIMHTFGAVVRGRQKTFNQATEAAIRAGLAYHIASDAVKTEAALAPKPKHKPKQLEKELIEVVESEPFIELRRNRVPVRDFNWTVRERLMMAFMANDQEEFLAALREVK